MYMYTCLYTGTYSCMQDLYSYTNIIRIHVLYNMYRSLHVGAPTCVHVHVLYTVHDRIGAPEYPGGMYSMYRY